MGLPNPNTSVTRPSTATSNRPGLHVPAPAPAISDKKPPPATQGGKELRVQVSEYILEVGGVRVQVSRLYVFLEGGKQGNVVWPASQRSHW